MMKFKFFLLAFLLFLGSAFSQANNKALLIGIGNYNTEATGWKKINGNNDVDLLSGKLKSNGFDVRVLKDKKATKKNISKALGKLVSAAQTGDVIYIHFSGHGQLVQDMNHDEPDGYDQSFVCFDAYSSPRYSIGERFYNGENHLIDDEIFPYLNQLKSKVGTDGKIIIAFDSCYSGDAARNDMIDDNFSDSEVEFTSTTRGTRDEFPADRNSRDYLQSIPSPSGYTSTGGQIIVISACERDRKNYETKEKHSGKQYGSLTYCVAKLLDNNVPMSEWMDFFNSKKYKSYKIFRDSQHPYVERY